MPENSVNPTERAQRTAEKAHSRIDEHGERLFRLDDHKTGMVTTMWNEKQATKKSIRNALYAMVVIAATSVFFSFWNGGRARGSEPVIDVNTVIQLAVQEAVKQITK